MFASIITFAKNAVTKYKVQRVRDVVTQYCATADAHVTTALPVAVEFYRGAATAIVDKTFENPEPALKLIEALDAVAKHYGPALSVEFEVLGTKLETLGTSPVITKRMEALLKAIKDLTTDVNDN